MSVNILGHGMSGCVTKMDFALVWAFALAMIVQLFQEIMTQHFFDANSQTGKPIGSTRQTTVDLSSSHMF